MQKKIELRLRNTNGMPMWVINNYISLLCEHCTKLYLLLKINDNMIDNSHVICLRESIPERSSGNNIKELINENKKEILNYLNAHNLDIKIKHNEYCVLSYAELDSFKMFLKLKRPMCFTIDSQNHIKYLYDVFEDEVMKVTDFKYHSPIEIIVLLAPTIIVAIKAIIELVWEYQKNKREEAREKDEHIFKIKKIILEMMPLIKENKEAINIMEKYFNKIYDDFIEMGIENIE